MYILWTTAGIILLFLDLAEPNKNKLAFACCFLFCAIVAFKFPQNYILQGFSFLFFALLFSCLIRVILDKEKKDALKESSLKDFINKKALVIKDIGKTLSIDGIGLIEYNGKTWSAKSVDDKEIKAGAHVRIVSKENKIMNVKVE